LVLEVRIVPGRDRASAYRDSQRWL